MRTLVTAVLLLFLGLGPARADDPPADRFGAEGEKRIVELTRWLEDNPLAENHTEVFTEVFQWWVEAPQLTLDWCPNLLMEARNKKASALVVGQGAVGAGAYLIEHRDQDSFAVSLAGVESALKTYEKAVAENGDYRDKFYDRLIERRKSGELESYVRRKLVECHSTEPPPGAADHAALTERGDRRCSESPSCSPVS